MADLIRRIRNVATSEGMDKVVADLRALTAAQEKFGDATNVVSIATARARENQLSATKALEATTKRVDEGYRNLTRYRAEVVNLARALQEGVTSQEDVNRLLDLAAIKYKQVRDTAGDLIEVQDALDRRTREYRESIDPLSAAQRKFNESITEAEDLYTSGLIDLDLYTKGVERAKKALRDAWVGDVKGKNKSQSDFNAFMGVRDDFKEKSRGEDIAAYGKALDDTRAKYDGLFQAQRDYKSYLKEIKDALAQGAISEDVYTDALNKRKVAFVTLMREMGRVSAPERAFNTAFDAATADNADFDRQRAAAEKEMATIQEMALAEDRLRTARAAAMKDLEDTRARYDDLFKVQRDYRAYLDDLSAALARNAISEDVYNEKLKERKAAFADLMRQMGRVSAAEREFNKAFDEATAINDDLNARSKAAREEMAAIQEVALAENRLRTARAAAMKDIDGIADAIQRERAEVIPLLKAQLEYEAQTEHIVALGKERILNSAEVAEALDREGAAYNRRKKAIEESGNGASKNFRLTGYEITNLSYQLNDMGTMLLSGSSPFQVIATQGGQVYQILAGTRGGLKEGVKSLGGQLLSLVTPARLAGGAVAAMGIAAVLAYDNWLNSHDKLQNALSGRGRATDATASQLEAISAAAAAASKISMSSATDVASSFAATGKIGSALYGDLTEAAKRYAKVTGTDIAEAGKKLAEALADPAKGAQDLDKELNFLDQSSLDLIRHFDSMNNRFAAQQVLVANLNLVLPKADQNLTAVGRGWQSVATWASRAYTEMGNAIDRFFKMPSIAEQIKRLEDQRANPMVRSGMQGPAQNANTAAELARLRAQQKEEEDRAARSGLAAQTQQTYKDAVAAARAADPRIEELQSLQKQIVATTGAINNAKTANTAFDEMWGGTSDTVKQLDEHLTGLQNRYNALADSEGNLRPVTEMMRKEMELQLAVINATTQADKNRAQAALEEYRARSQGATDTVATATGSNSLTQANAEMQAQALQAQRERTRAAQEAVGAQKLELDLIGKTAGETAVLRANYAALVDLQREEFVNGTPFDKARYEALKLQNQELGKQVDLVQRMSLRDQVKFDLSQIGRSSADQSIASTLRSQGLPVDLESYDASILRLRDSILSLKDASTEFATSFLSDLRNGTTLTDALSNATNRLYDRLLNMAVDQAISGLFKSLMGGGGGMGGIFSSLLGIGSGSSAINVVGGAGPMAVPTFQAAGGRISGPGTGVSDSIVARVSNGEFIVNAEATKRNLPALQAMNSGSMPRFANGGMVGGAGGINVFTNVQTLPGTTADVTPVVNEDGISLDIVMRKVSKKVESDIIEGIQKRGRVGRALESGYGLKRSV